MPLIKRGIEPVHVSRAVVPASVRNELEFVSNNTLSNVILQLSSLSKHAEDVFGELHRETCCVLYRSGQLNDRIGRLKQKIVQLNPTVEEGIVASVYIVQCIISVDMYSYFDSCFFFFTEPAFLLRAP